MCPCSPNFCEVWILTCVCLCLYHQSINVIETQAMRAANPFLQGRADREKRFAHSVVEKPLFHCSFITTPHGTAPTTPLQNIYLYHYSKVPPHSTPLPSPPRGNRRLPLTLCRLTKVTSGQCEWGGVVWCVTSGKGA